MVMSADNLHIDIAVKGGGRENFRAQRSNTSIGKQWWSTMDDSGVILLIQAVINAKIASK